MLGRRVRLDVLPNAEELDARRKLISKKRGFGLFILEVILYGHGNALVVQRPSPIFPLRPTPSS